MVQSKLYKKLLKYIFKIKGDIAILLSGKANELDKVKCVLYQTNRFVQFPLV